MESLKRLLLLVCERRFVDQKRVHWSLSRQASDIRNVLFDAERSHITRFKQKFLRGGHPEIVTDGGRGVVCHHWEHCDALELCNIRVVWPLGIYHVNCLVVTADSLHVQELFNEQLAIYLWVRARFSMICLQEACKAKVMVSVLVSYKYCLYFFNFHVIELQLQKS